MLMIMIVISSSIFPCSIQYTGLLDWTSIIFMSCHSTRIKRFCTQVGLWFGFVLRIVRQGKSQAKSKVQTREKNNFELEELCLQGSDYCKFSM